MSLRRHLLLGASPAALQTSRLLLVSGALALAVATPVAAQTLPTVLSSPVTGTYSFTGSAVLSSSGTAITAATLAGGTVVNAGAITAQAPKMVGIKVGTMSAGLVGNAGGGVLSGGSGNLTGVLVSAMSGGTVSNAGQILSSSVFGLAVTSMSGGTISNEGTIAATFRQGAGIYVPTLTGSGVTIANQAGGVITAVNGIFVGGIVSFSSSPATGAPLTGKITNAGRISAVTSFALIGIEARSGVGAGGTIVNSGTISTALKSAQGSGIEVGGHNLTNPASVGNVTDGLVLNTGLIDLPNGGSTQNIGININGSVIGGTISNQGVITISGPHGFGVAALSLGNDTASGAIARIDNSGTVVGLGTGAETGIAVSQASSGTISNSGLISGASSPFTGISIGGLSATLLNSGSISGPIGAGIRVETVASGGLVYNQAGGTVGGGVGIAITSLSGGTLLNAGAVGDTSSNFGITIFGITIGALSAGLADNTATGTVFGTNGIQIGAVGGAAAGLASNEGLIQVSASGLTAGTLLNGTLINNSGGLISVSGAGTGLGAGLVGVTNAKQLASSGTVVNAGSIVAPAGAGIGIGTLLAATSGCAATGNCLAGVVVNSGAISAKTGIAATLIGNGTLLGSGTAIANSGLISASAAGIGVGTLGGATIANSASGVITVAGGIGIGIGTLTGGAIANAGLISAQTAISIGSGNLALINSGSIAGAIQNAGGTLSITGGSAANPGVLNGAITATNVIFAGGAQSLAGNVTGAVTNAATLMVSAPRSISGNFTETAGTLVIGVGGTTSGSYGELVVGGAAALTGSTITLAAESGFHFAAGETFTLIDATGGVGSLSGDTFVAGAFSVTSTLVAGTELEVVLSGGPVSVSLASLSGTTYAVPAGSLLSGTAAFQVSGAIAANGTLSNAGTIAGTSLGVSVGTLAGSIANAATGTISAANGIAVAVGTASGGAIVNAGLISAQTAISIGAGDLALVNSGSIAGAIKDVGGTLSITGGSAANPGALNGAITATNVVFAGGAQSLAGNVTGTVTNAATLMVSAPRSISGNFSQSASSAVLDIVVGGSGTVASSFGELVVAGSASLTGGVIELTGASGFTFAGGEVFTVVAANGALTESGLTISLSGAENGSLGQTINASGGDLLITLTGAAAGAPVSLASLSGTTYAIPAGSLIAGTTAFKVSGAIAASGALSNAGTIAGTSLGVSVGTLAGSIANAATGTISAANGIAVAVGTASGGAIVNAGLISAQTAISIGSGNLSLANSGNIAGAIKDVGGTLSITGGSTANPGVLNGAITATNVVFAGGAQSLAGNVTGTVTNAATLMVSAPRSISGNFSQSASSAVLDIVVGGSGTVASSFGELVVAGSASLTSGVIELIGASGFTFTSGEVFTVVAATGGLTESGLTISLSGSEAGTLGQSISASGGDLLITLTGGTLPISTVTASLASPFSGNYTNTVQIVAATGIQAAANVVGGTISNVGSIVATKYGIDIVNALRGGSTTGGLVSNSGSIRVSGQSAAGIALANFGTASSGLSGLVSNSGLISVTGGGTLAGIAVSSTLSAGSIANAGSGRIAVSLTGNSGIAAGILVNAFNGGTVSNAGTITLSGGNGGLSGGNLIAVVGTAAGNTFVAATGAGVGIYIENDISGSETVANSGVIQAPVGILVAGGPDSRGSVSITNTGTIIAGNGIGIYGGAAVSNLGVISGETGIAVAAVLNSGTINATNLGAALQSGGEPVFTNSGLITVSNGVGLSVSGALISTIVNSGVVSAPIAIYATSSPNLINSGSFAGNIVVSGSQSVLRISANGGVGTLSGVSGNVGAIVSPRGVTFLPGANQVLDDNITASSSTQVLNQGALTIIHPITVTANLFDNQANGNSGVGSLFSSSLTFGVSGTSSSSHGELVVSGGFAIGSLSSLDLVAQGAFTFAQGEVFTIVSANTINGLETNSLSTTWESGTPDLTIVNGSGTATGTLNTVSGNTYDLLVVTILSASGGGGGSVVNIGSLNSTYSVPSGSLISGATAFKVTVVGSGGTISNAGTISGTGNSGVAVSIGTLSGGVANLAGGSIVAGGVGIGVATVTGGAISNSGLISAQTAISIGSGSLALTNAGSIVGAIKDAGGTLSISGGSAANPGVLNGAITASNVAFASGAQSLTGSLISGAVANSGATLMIAGQQSITGNFSQSAGTLAMGVNGTATGNYGELLVGGTASLSGGTLALGAATGFHFAVGEVLTLVASSSDVSGSFGGLTITDGARTVSGAMSDVGDDLLVSITTVTANAGTMLGSVGSVYTIGSGTTIAGGTGVLVTVVGSGGTISNAGVVMSTIKGGTGLLVNTLAGGALVNSGAISTSSGIGISVGTLNGSGSIGNSGTISGKTGIGIWSGTGTLALSNSGSIGGTIVDLASGALTIGGGSLSAPGTLGGAVTATGGLVLAAGGAQVVSQNITVGGGYGTVVNNGMLMLPADPTISGNYVQTASGAGLQIGVASTSNYAELVVTGGATLTNGTILLSAQNNFTFAGGEIFTVVSAGSAVSASGLAISLSGAESGTLSESYSVNGDTLLVTIAGTTGGGGGTGPGSVTAGTPVSIASLNSIYNLPAGTLISGQTAVQIGVIGGGGVLNNAGSLQGSGAGAFAVKVGTLAGGAISNSGAITAASGIAVAIASPGDGTLINRGLISGRTALSIGGGLLNINNSGVISGNIGGTAAILTISGAGGSLQFGTLSADSVLFVPGAQQNLNGVVDAAGVLTNQGILSGASGGTVISAPTLSGPIVNSGLIVAGGSGVAIGIGSVAGGSISNSGVISAQTAIRAAAGGLYISNSGTIAGAIIDNDALQGLTIAGTGGTLNGGAIRAASVTFASGSQLLAENIVAGGGGGAVINNATLGLNARQSITGNYIQGSGGMLKIGVGGTIAGSYGELVVSGAVTMTNGRISLAALNGYQAAVGTVLTIVSASASGSSFAGVSAVAGGYGFTTSSVVVGATDDLLATITSLPSGLAATGYTAVADAGASAIRASSTARTMASVLDQLVASASSGQFSALFDALSKQGTLSGSVGEARAIKQLAPSQLGGAVQAPTTLVELSRQVTDAIAAHTAARAAAADPASGLLPGDAGASSSVWAQVLGRSAQRNGDAGTDGYKVSSYGVAAGADLAVSRSLLGGVALSWGQGNASGLGDIMADSAHVNSYQVSGYGLWMPGPLTVDGMVGYVFNRFDQHRALPFLGQTATAAYNGTQVVAHAGAGYAVPLTDTVTLTPTTSLHYLHADTDGYGERGAGVVDLTVGSATADVVQTRFGGKVQWTLYAEDLGRLVPEVKAAWVHDFGNGALQTAAQLGGIPFTTSVPRPARNGVEMGAAMTLYDSDGVGFSLRYDGDFRSNYSSNAGQLNLEVPF